MHNQFSHSETENFHQICSLYRNVLDSLIHFIDDLTSNLQFMKNSKRWKNTSESKHPSNKKRLAFLRLMEWYSCDEYTKKNNKKRRVRDLRVSWRRTSCRWPVSRAPVAVGIDGRTPSAADRHTAVGGRRARAPAADLVGRVPFAKRRRPATPRSALTVDPAPSPSPPHPTRRRRQPAIDASTRRHFQVSSVGINRQSLALHASSSDLRSLLILSIVRLLLQLSQ